MRVTDESVWQQRLAEFAADPHPSAPVLQKFLIDWAENAEGMIDQYEFSVMDCLRKTLNVVEAQQSVPFIPTSMIGAALVLLSMHWKYGPEVAQEMNQIELHLVQEVTAHKLAQLQQQAQEAGNEA